MTPSFVTYTLVSKKSNMFNIHDLTHVMSAVIGRIGGRCGRMIFIHFFIKENFYINNIVFSFENDYLIKTYVKLSVSCGRWLKITSQKVPT